MKGEFNSVILYDFASPSPLGTFDSLEMFLVILTVGSHKRIYGMLPSMLQYTGQPPTTKSFSAPNINSTKTEKP